MRVAVGGRRAVVSCGILPSAEENPPLKRSPKVLDAQDASTDKSASPSDEVCASQNCSCPGRAGYAPGAVLSKSYEERGELAPPILDLLGQRAQQAASS